MHVIREDVRNFSDVIQVYHFLSLPCFTGDLDVEVSQLHPADIVVEGDDLILQCKINLNPQELDGGDIVWTDPKGGNPTGSYVGNGVYNLIITNVTAGDDTGTYSCSATTPLQTGDDLTVSSEIFIDVMGKLVQMSSFRDPMGWCMTYDVRQILQ